jgi:hypothetical protein
LPGECNEAESEKYSQMKHENSYFCILNELIEEQKAIPSLYKPAIKKRQETEFKTT